MIEALSVNLDTDLRAFSHHLSSQGIAHRITEESGSQVVWVASEALIPVVQEEFRRQDFVAAEHQWQQAPRSSGSGKAVANQVLRFVWTAPVCSTLLLLCLLTAAYSSLGSQASRVDFLFFPLLDSSSLLAMLSDISGPVEFLRTLTPMFLHFGELHLIFNMLWLLYFGRQLEPIHPVWLFLLLVVLLSFLSNSAQYLSVHYNNFGGMSGVVYGLVGYTWVVHNFMPVSRLLLNSSMFMFFVIALVAMEVLAGSYIATAAHVGGLVAGILLGAVVVAYYRLILKRAAISR